MVNMVETGVYLWLLTFIFCLGVLLIPLSLLLIIMPEMVMRFANRVNTWVSTNSAFDQINRPRYQEKTFYRHHRLFGSLIVLLSALCIYLLGVYLDGARLMDIVYRLTDSEFARWLLVEVYYLLLVGLVICVVMGVVIFIRPSVLKSLESWSNRWLDTESCLEAFDSIHEFPVRMSSGRLRLLGVFVLVGGSYMLYVTGRLIF